MEYVEIFILLVAFHALADYPLQGDFLAKAKNHTAPIPGVPWWQAMWAHSAIHAGGVLLITGSVALAAIEFVTHALTDYAKCSGFISYNQDQGIHVILKVIYCFMLGVAL